MEQNTIGRRSIYRGEEEALAQKVSHQNIVVVASLILMMMLAACAAPTPAEGAEEPTEEESIDGDASENVPMALGVSVQELQAALRPQ